MHIMEAQITLSYWYLSFVRLLIELINTFHMFTDRFDYVLSIFVTRMQIRTFPLKGNYSVMNSTTNRNMFSKWTMEICTSILPSLIVKIFLDNLSKADL